METSRQRLAGLTRRAAPAMRIRVFQMPRPAIQFLTAICEAADGVGLVRTLDERRGLVECWVMPDFAPDFNRLIASTGRHWPIQETDTEFE